MTMSFKRPVLVTGVFLMALFISSSAFSAGDKDKTDKLPLIRSIKDPVARVDGKVITEETLRIAVNNVMPMKSFHTTVSDRRFAVLRKEALEKLINNELIFNGAVARNEDKVTDKEFDEGLAELKKRLRPGNTIEEILKRSNMTMDDLKKELKYDIVITRVRKNAKKNVRKESETLVTEKYMRDYYNTHLAKFMEPAQLHLRGMLIRVDPSASQRDWTKAKKRIYDLSSEVRKGADFAELAKKHSQAASAPKGGDMGWVHEGSLLPDIDAAVSKLKVGELSKPVMSIYGFHVFKLEGRKSAKQKKFSELNIKRLKSELVAKEYKVRWEKWLKDLRKDAKIEYLKKI